MGKEFWGLRPRPEAGTNRIITFCFPFTKHVHYSCKNVFLNRNNVSHAIFYFVI